MLSKKDLKKLTIFIRERFGCEIQNNIRNGYIVRSKNMVLYILKSLPAVIEINGSKYPTIHILNSTKCDISFVVIDEGAEPHILNGADVMIPGIVDLTNFNVGDIVGVKSIKHGSYIAIGVALMDSTSIRELRKGKAVKNIHYAGDNIWRFILDSLKKIHK